MSMDALAHSRAAGWKCSSFDLKQTFSCMCVATSSFLLILLVCLLYLPEPSSHQPIASASEESREVTLLIWTHPFGQYSQLPDCWALYQIHGCTLTDDRLTYLRADAVLIHHREVANKVTRLPPEPRPPNQKWIWMNFESPSNTRGLWRFQGVLNLTMSYRRDSDIFLPYGYLIPYSHTEGPRNCHKRLLRRSSHSPLLRPNLVAWVISNWSESQARVAFYYQLRQYIQVDVFGRAGRPLPKLRGKASVVRLVRRYQFYLALENSQHTDYITEKLWNAVQGGAVPVVMGPSRDNYERFLPPEAFIHVDDFPTVRGLANYLLLLRQNPARMRKHLDWRENYGMHQPTFWAERYCTACMEVRRTKNRTEVIRDIEDWFLS
ncbi:alpha-(1,3)-fucosyltransferase 4-like [Genypterus blacodes]|uniref:alpha-(1,3)-fucosyltransferase 4-like n=1 Tax=Genypterus blacodes TaxID=154954 RepID=UPI003F7698A8